MLGAARVVHLGYAESGHGPVLYRDPPGRVRFARADVDEAAGKLASLIRAEHADLLLSYDSHGGYGHRDHMQVHRVGARAARLAGGVRVLEATLPWELAARLAVALMPLRLVARFDLGNAVRRSPPGQRSPAGWMCALMRPRSERPWQFTSHSSMGKAGPGSCFGC